MNGTGDLAASFKAMEVGEQAQILQRLKMLHAARPDAELSPTTIRTASTITPSTIEWLWAGFVPLGALTLLYGQEGGGKSVFTMDLAARATLGKLEGALKGSPVSVEIIAYEDDAANVILPRLMAAGADLDRVHVHGGEYGEDMLILPDGVATFIEGMRERGSRLVIIDPLADTLREGLKDNNNGDVRTGLIPLARGLQMLGAAGVGVAHPNKGATDAANKVMGSKAWRSVPRSVLIHGRDPDNPEGTGRIVAVSKSNYAVHRAIRYDLESVEVEIDGATTSQPGVRNLKASDYTDQDVILADAGGDRDDRKLTDKERAELLLGNLLESGGGEIDPATAYAAGKAADISERTMQKAKIALGVEGRKVWKLRLAPVAF